MLVRNSSKTTTETKENDRTKDSIFEAEIHRALAAFGETPTLFPKLIQLAIYYYH